MRGMLAGSRVISRFGSATRFAGKFKSTAYLSTVILVGFALLTTQVWSLRPGDMFRFLAYLVLAMLAASMKVSLPGFTGTLSVLFLLLLIGIVDLTLPE